jgi:hypothetical protein
MRDGRMHQTTVRFGPDLWEALENECRRLGVSAAQYLREAALARLAYTAGWHHEPEYRQALEGAGAAPIEAHSPGHDAREAAAERVMAATAVSAQSRQAWRKAREVREQAVELRRRRREST